MEQNSHHSRKSPNFRLLGRKVLFCLALLLFFSFFYEVFFSRQNSWTEIKTKTQTFFLADKVKIFSFDKEGSSLFIKADHAEMRSEEGSKVRKLFLKKNVFFKSEQETNSFFYIFSDYGELVWKLSGAKRDLDKTNLKEFFFKGNVLAEKESKYLTSESLYYLYGERLAYSRDPSRFLFPFRYWESKGGFEWFLEDDIFKAGKSVEGFSYEEN